MLQRSDTFRHTNASGNEIQRLKPYPDPSCIVLPKAGYAIIKGNHQDCRFMVSVLATSLCRTHKHEDNLSFTLFFDGLEWLIDPSFYSHEYISPLPLYLRSAAAHNCLALPGRSYSIDPGRAQIDGSCDGTNFVLKGQHSAYRNVVVQREIQGSIDRLELNILDRAIAQTPLREVIMRRPGIIFNNVVRKYALTGILFGLLFPVSATIARILSMGLAVSPSSIAAVQSGDWLLWIIDTAPIFLGLFAGFAGHRQDAPKNKRRTGPYRKGT